MCVGFFDKEITSLTFFNSLYTVIDGSASVIRLVTVVGSHRQVKSSSRISER